MASVVVKMLTTASSEEGHLHAGTKYRISAEQAAEWSKPHPETGTISCEILSREDYEPGEIRTPDVDTEEKGSEEGNAPPSVPRSGRRRVNSGQ